MRLGPCMEPEPRVYLPFSFKPLESLAFELGPIGVVQCRNHRRRWENHSPVLTLAPGRIFL